MEYIGNFSSWIQQEWIDFLLDDSNQGCPNDIYSLQKAKDAGYVNGDDTKHEFWRAFTSKEFPFTLTPPLPNMNNDWWFIKLKPGGFMPMHTDFKPHENSCERYWMTLQDYESGHIFVYDDQLLTGYSKGDVFKFSHPYVLHGCSNISYIPRLTFNFQ